MPSLHRRRLVASLPLLFTGLYLRPALADPQVRQASQSLMGTRVDITAQGRHAVDTDAAMAAALAEMARLSDTMNRYKVDSVVNALYLAGGLQPVKVPPELMRVLQMAQSMAWRSQGAFDVTVGALHSWSFEAGKAHVPAAQALARELSLVNHQDLILDERQGTAYLRRRGMRLDLGGIAKLPILQAGLQVLKQHGVSNAMINGGGDVLVSGQLQGRNWRVGLRDPRMPERVLGVVELSEGFVAASGDYERFFLQDGRRYHHILDPKSGHPTTGPRGVALVSRRLEDINGLGAAIMVAGAQVGQQWLASLGSVDALMVLPDQRVWQSAGMRNGCKPSEPA